MEQRLLPVSRFEYCLVDISSLLAIFVWLIPNSYL